MAIKALDGAWLRFRRADAHLAEASRLVQEFGKACKHHIVADNDTNPKPSIILRTTPDLPAMLPVVVSDAIHNMRAALDYIVFELARHDSKKLQNGTQFLIEDYKVDRRNSKRGFDGKKSECLKGLSNKHVDMIEDLQPYKGVEWTKTIRDISNPDKHRNLTSVCDDGYFQFTYDGDGSLTDKPLVINPDDWHVDPSNAVYIAPANLNESALMPTLREIQSGVCSALELFQAEF